MGRNFDSGEQKHLVALFKVESDEVEGLESVGRADPRAAVPTVRRKAWQSRGKEGLKDDNIWCWGMNFVIRSFANGRLYLDDPRRVSIRKIRCTNKRFRWMEYRRQECFVREV